MYKQRDDNKKNTNQELNAGFRTNAKEHKQAHQMGRIQNRKRRGILGIQENNDELEED